MSRISLFTSNLQIADAISREYKIPGAGLEDSVQEARVALWEATSFWDEERGPFKAFARLYIHGRMRDRIKHANRPGRMALTDSSREYDAIEHLDPLEQREELRSLARRIAALNERDRETLARIVNEVPIADKKDDNDRYRVRRSLRKEES